MCLARHTFQLLQNCNDANITIAKSKHDVASLNALSGQAPFSTTNSLECNGMIQTGILSSWANQPAKSKTQHGKGFSAQKGVVRF